MKTRLFLSATVVAMAMHPTCGFAQDDVYPPAFFERVQPANAYDMLAIVPGFTLDEGDSGVRGYSGSGGNVLVDGQRPSSKEDDLNAILKRIPASRVDHVELIRSGARGIDMQGYAMLVNVVRRVDARLSGRGEIGSGWSTRGASAPRLAGAVAYASGSRRLDVNAVIAREIDAKHGYGRRDRFAPDGSALQLADYAQPESERVMEIGAGYRQDVLGGTLQLNGLFKQIRKASDIEVGIIEPDLERLRSLERGRERVREGSASYRLSMNDGGVLDIFASLRASTDRGEEREVGIADAGRSFDSETGRETIGRAVYRRPVGQWNMAMGFEAAINALDSASSYLDGTTSVAVPEAAARVRERRGEVFLEGTWSPGSAVMAEAGMHYEVSRISLLGEGDLARTFRFAKPRLRVTWSPGGSDRLRILVEQEVGQLDFGDFTGSASLTNGTVTAGNRNLAPSSLWRGELAYEHHMGMSSIVLTGRREWISDVIDRLPLVSDGKLYDSVGNIGNATRMEAEADLNLRLDGLGLPGLGVRTLATWRRSRVADPVTGLRRRISGETPLSGEVRMTHDMPELRLRWGVGYVLGKQDIAYKVTEISESRLGARVDAFAEFKPSSAWTLRVVGSNLTDSPSVRRRAIYTGDYGHRTLRYTEVRSMRSGRYFGFTLQRSLGG